MNDLYTSCYLIRNPFKSRSMSRTVLCFVYMENLSTASFTAQRARRWLPKLYVSWGATFLGETSTSTHRSMRDTLFNKISLLEPFLVNQTQWSPAHSPEDQDVFNG